MHSTKNKHIVITGGAKGIGRACVETFLKAESKVSVLDIDESSDIPEFNGSTYALYKTDVAKESQVKQRMEDAIRRFGEIDVLINNAGIVKYGSVTETSE